MSGCPIFPQDAESFPVSTWFRDLLERGVQTFVLNSQVIRHPSPPGLGHSSRPTDRISPG